MFEIPAGVSIRTGYTPGAAFALGSTRNDTERPGPSIVPGFSEGVTTVNDAGSVEDMRAPSPIFRPSNVSVNGRPTSAPRGLISVITGVAANAACAIIAARHTPRIIANLLPEGLERTPFS